MAVRLYPHFNSDEDMLTFISWFYKEHFDQNDLDALRELQYVKPRPDVLPFSPWPELDSWYDELYLHERAHMLSNFEIFGMGRLHPETRQFLIVNHHDEYVGYCDEYWHKHLILALQTRQLNATIFKLVTHVSWS